MGVCSSPLGAWLEANWPVATGCCAIHDDDYHKGGDGKARHIVDLKFYL